MATDSILRPGELKDLLLKEIKAADLADIDVREVGTVLEVKDGIARIYGLTSAMAGEMLEFSVSVTGEKITGLALNLEEDNIGAVIFGDYLQLREGDEVRRTGRVLEVPVGPAVVGRVVDALGRRVGGRVGRRAGPPGGGARPHPYHKAAQSRSHGAGHHQAPAGEGAAADRHQ